jgi:CubicO group peptidase (beta-lactamase class C family)
MEQTKVKRIGARRIAGILALSIIVVLLAFIVIPWLRGARSPSTPAYWPTMGWRTSTPEEQGFDSAKMAEGLLAIREQNIRIHSLMLIRNGAVFLDAYFYPYDGSTYHDLGSVTKSIVTTLIGIAADQGKLDLDAPLLSFFPDRDIANRDERKERITLRHLASNTSGLHCDPSRGEITQKQMRASEDWVQFVLDRKVLYDPGTHFAYCSPGMHLLSAILTQATGMSALDFARANLFEPLGIGEVYWPYDAQGINHGWGDLSLYPADAAKIGQLFLQQGEWHGRQIVSREWVDAATHQQATTPPGQGEDYGYGWWLARPDAEVNSFNADGRNGQKIVVVPALELVAVMTGGGGNWDEVDDTFAAAMRGNEPLPANPAGVAQLQTVVATLAQPPAAEPVKPMPDIARAVSGRRYVFPSEPWVRGVQLELEASEATFSLDLATESTARVVGVGLDGIYRASRGGRASLARGGWADDHTFEIEYNEGPGMNRLMFWLRFEGDKVWFGIHAAELSLTFEGTAAEP